jgi:hypothetical protein
VVRSAIGAARSLAVLAIMVGATDEKAAAFYRDLGFAPFPNRPLRLFMPTARSGGGCFPRCLDSRHSPNRGHSDDR